MVLAPHGPGWSMDNKAPRGTRLQEAHVVRDHWANVGWERARSTGYPQWPYSRHFPAARLLADARRGGGDYQATHSPKLPAGVLTSGWDSVSGPSLRQGTQSPVLSSPSLRLGPSPQSRPAAGDSAPSPIQSQPTAGTQTPVPSDPHSRSVKPSNR